MKKLVNSILLFVAIATTAFAQTTPVNNPRITGDARSVQNISISAVSLSGGNVLNLGSNYYDTLSTARTLTFSGTPIEGKEIGLLLTNVTGNPVLSFPASVELGGGSTTPISSIALENGPIQLRWIYRNGVYYISVGGGGSSSSVNFSSIGGDPNDNLALASALAAKADIPVAANFTGGGPYNIVLQPELGSLYTVAITGNTTFTASSGAGRRNSKIEAIVTGGPWTITIPASYRNGSATTSTSFSVPNGRHYFSIGTTDGGSSYVWDDTAEVYLSASSKVDAIQAGFYAADSGSTDAYAITLSPAITAYTTGVNYRFKANTANTGAATININGLGARTIYKSAGGITTNLADNDIRVGQVVDLVYDGTNMQMQSVLGNAASGGGFPATYTQTGASANTSTNGVTLENTTTAASGNQQYSPFIQLTGQGWKTTATSASQTVDWKIYNLPVQGSSAPTSQLNFDSQVNGGGYSNRFYFTSGGLFSSTNMLASGSGYIGINGKSVFKSSLDGIIELLNNSQNSFTRLNLGSNTSSFPALARVGATIEVKLADDSALTAIQSLYDRYGSGSPEGAITAPVGATYHRTDGGAGTSLYVKESGTGNTGWVAK